MSWDLGDNSVASTLDKINQTRPGVLDAKLAEAIAVFVTWLKTASPNGASAAAQFMRNVPIPAHEYAEGWKHLLTILDIKSGQP